MEYFQDLTAKEMFSSISDPKKITEYYADGLKTHNPLVALCAQNELARRGDFDLIRKELDGFIQKDKDLKLGSMFTEMLGSSLTEMRSIDPVLGYIGKQLLNPDAKDEKLGQVDSEVADEAILIKTLRELIEKHGYQDHDFYQLVEDIFDKYD